MREYKINKTQNKNAAYGGYRPHLWFNDGKQSICASTVNRFYSKINKIRDTNFGIISCFPCCFCLDLLSLWHVQPSLLNFFVFWDNIWFFQPWYVKGTCVGALNARSKSNSVLYSSVLVAGKRVVADGLLRVLTWLLHINCQMSGAI